MGESTTRGRCLRMRPVSALYLGTKLILFVQGIITLLQRDPELPKSKQTQPQHVIPAHWERRRKWDLKLIDQKSASTQCRGFALVCLIREHYNTRRWRHCNMAGMVDMLCAHYSIQTSSKSKASTQERPPLKLKTALLPHRHCCYQRNKSK